MYGTQSAELPTQETPRQNWAETIQKVIQQEQAERRLAEERAGMEETIREQGWTQERIGKALGVARRTISDWIGTANPPYQNSDNSPTPTENLETIMIHAGKGFCRASQPHPVPQHLNTAPKAAPPSGCRFRRSLCCGLR